MKNIEKYRREISKILATTGDHRCRIINEKKYQKISDMKQVCLQCPLHVIDCNDVDAIESFMMEG
ncbi:MAG: hypothetical protein RR623_08640 [Bacilli bacterium]